MNKYVFAIIFLFCLGFTSCRDDMFDNIFYNGGDGIVLDIDFMPMADNDLQSRSDPVIYSFPGNGMSDIRDICLVIFDVAGNFKDVVDISTDHYEEIKNYERTESDTSNGLPPAETTTIRRKYNLDLPTGDYYVYAVANLGEYASDNSILKSTYAALTDVDDINISSLSRDQFRKIRRVWSKDNFRNNSEMTGVCTVGALPGDAVYTSDTDHDAPISLHAGLNLHCWLRRLASKLTVDFDASNLDPSTTIYLKEIRVRDIPYDCSLFEKNRAYHSSIGENTVPIDQPGGLRSPEAHGIRLCDNAYALSDNGEQDHRNWPFITSGVPTLRDLAVLSDTDPSIPASVKAQKELLLQINHSNAAPCIFFYENMQGRDESKPKAADADLDGIIDSPDSYEPDDKDFKDQMPGGTYVEVIAYYHSLAKGNEGEGNIIYRFMLGKDVICDYNVERNYHYKLTMCFNGYANDVDWHIEYDRDKPAYSMPDEYYISYGYNEMMEFPITVSGELKDGLITAEIVQNDWQPSIMWVDQKPQTFPNNASTYSPFPAAYIPYPNDDHRGVSLGFLSLRKSQNDVIGATKAASEAGSHSYIWRAWSGMQLDQGDKSRNQFITDNSLYQTNYDGLDYYDTDYKGKRTLGYRVYKFDGLDSETPTGDLNYTSANRPEYAETEDGGYRVHTIKSSSSIYPRTSTFYIPMYTRERNICTKTGFTGENPYKNFQRRAKVRIRFTVIDRHGNEHKCDKVVNIIQVVKLGNPMGIWRDWNNAAPFEVQLKYLKEDGINFEDLTSHEGGWSAEVEVGADWILLNGGKKKVTGKKDEKIRFTYRPVGILSNKNQVRCGIITIRYHNFACVHKIFVRQGYAPLRLSPNSAAFHTGNLITSSSEATNPCDEGSMFKCGNLDYPIASSNNVNDIHDWARVAPNMFKDHSNTDFKIAGTSITRKWSEIPSYGSPTTFTWPEITINGKTATIMRISDIKELRDGSDSDTDRSRYQFGVLYTDKSIYTGNTIHEAFHYKQNDPATHSYGMRGCFVYNNTDGKQIFFPIGSSGYGVRKAKRNTMTAPNELGWYENPEVGTAVLRYSAGRITYNNTPTYIPLLWDIFSAEGACYWADAPGWDSTKESPIRTSLDLNFRTFDFNTLGEELFNGTKVNAANGSDACFIRLIDP